MRAAVFLDRDGVIIENRPDHVKSWSEVVFLEGAMPALRRLAQLPLAIVIVSNQGVVGRRLMTLDAAWEVQRRIVAEIEAAAGRVDASYLCPHHPDAGCDCRKPSPGMLLQAARDLDLKLGDSWLVGDALSDMQAAAKARVRGILVRTGRGTEQEACMSARAACPWPVVAHLGAAVELILSVLEGRTTP